MSGPQPNPPAPRPVGTFKIGSIAGSDVLVSSSWFVVAALIAVSVSPQVEAVQPGLGALKYVAGVAFAVILYGSVLLHEAAHALMARHYGFPVSSITLHFLGGVTAIEAEASKPRQEFWIAVVGPLTSLAVGGGAVGLYFVTPDGVLLLAVEGLAIGNLIVGVLNLVPGLPLDGGRVFKAAIWQLTGSQYRGTIVAGWAGRVAAVAVLGYPLLQRTLYGVSPGIFDFFLAFVVAIFLWGGASAAIGSARIRRRLPLLVARNLARRTLTVPEDLPLAEAMRRAQEAEAGAVVTVTASGRTVGVVSEAALSAIPEARRPWVAVSTVARDADALTLPADITGESLVDAMGRTPASEYLLVEAEAASSAWSPAETSTGPSRSPRTREPSRAPRPVSSRVATVVRRAPRPVGRG